MINLSISNEAAAADLAQMQNSIRAAVRETTDAGLEKKLLLGLNQLDRFVAANIQVQAGRTKNSVFQSMDKQGNNVVAGLHSNVRYSPYVGHVPLRSSEQFFVYAAKTEGPRVAEYVAVDIATTVEQQFQ